MFTKQILIFQGIAGKDTIYSHLSIFAIWFDILLIQSVICFILDTLYFLVVFSTQLREVKRAELLASFMYSLKSVFLIETRSSVRRYFFYCLLRYYANNSRYLPGLELVSIINSILLNYK